MKILNLYSGIGGNRKLWGDEHEITAVEYDPQIAEVYQDFFPDDKVIVADAHQYLLDHFKEYDFIWSSPPCTTHSRVNKNFGFVRYADMRLYEEIILLKTWFDGKFCIENVIPYYGEYGLIIRDLLPQQHHRHLFWCNFKIKTTGKENPPKQINIKAKNVDYEKSFIDIDDPYFLADSLGMPRIKKNIYINGNHSPGQLYRNCVKPEIGAMILDCAMGIIRKEDTKQLDIFSQQ